MQLKALFDDDDAVSPVIGVILMVAITVILAAVIGTFVLGLGSQVQNDAPQASFTFDFSTSVATADCSSTLADGTSGGLTVTHDGGDQIDGTKLFIGDDDSAANQEWTGDCSGSTDVSAGNSITAQVGNDDTIRVLWQAGGENSATLGKWTGPNA